jgi:hypothetical protein
MKDILELNAEQAKLTEIIYKPICLEHVRRTKNIKDPESNFLTTDPLQRLVAQSV